MAAWLRREAGGDILLALHVQPGAKRTEIAGTHGEALKIRLAAAPVEGRANDCLIRFLAEFLQVPRGQVALVSGDASRQKRLRVRGAAAQAVDALLAAAGNSKAEARNSKPR